MKKLFILFCLVLLSCSYNYNHQNRERCCTSDYTKIDGLTTIQKVEYCGHSYILVTSTKLEGCGVGFLHDPDCPCKINKQ